jgi:predicted HTH transcriptional regulator
MARTPFGPSWEDLNLDALGAFFMLGEEETLTWECKGGEVGSKNIVRAVCGFANSNRGGYLVLGVSGGPSKGGWVPNGWVPPTEARVYLGQVIADGVAPQPPFDVQSWALPDGREVSVVQVGRVAVPPAITSSGGVFERLPGQTRQISDPTTLRRLFERGQAASERASLQAVVGLNGGSWNQGPVGNDRRVPGIAIAARRHLVEPIPEERH